MIMALGVINISRASLRHRSLTNLCQDGFESGLARCFLNGLGCGGDFRIGPFDLTTSGLVMVSVGSKQQRETPGYRASVAGWHFGRQQDRKNGGAAVTSSSGHSSKRPDGLRDGSLLSHLHP